MVCSQRLRSSGGIPWTWSAPWRVEPAPGSTLIAFWRRMQVSNLAAAEFCMTRDALGLAQCRVAQLFAIGPRSVRRWRDGTRRIPRGVDIVLRLLAARAVTVAQVEEIAFSTQTDGNAKGEP